MELTGRQSEIEDASERVATLLLDALQENCGPADTVWEATGPGLYVGIDGRFDLCAVAATLLRKMPKGIEF